MTQPPNEPHPPPHLRGRGTAAEGGGGGAPSKPRKTPSRQVERARKLRREMSPAERILWKALQTRPGGFRFRKQHPEWPYTLDFFCHDAGLAIEVDGDAHDMGSNPAGDEARDTDLAARGIATLRIPAAEVFSNMEGVIVHIVERCRSRSPG